jgi:hypothetical protein
MFNADIESKSESRFVALALAAAKLRVGVSSVSSGVDEDEIVVVDGRSYVNSVPKSPKLISGELCSK